MNKSYARINWENYPSVNTPVNEQNLNRIDKSLDIVDDRVIILDETKATKLEISTLFSDVAFDESTGIITFTRKNGSTLVIDTQMEKIALNIYYDLETEKLIVPLVDGTQYEVDLSRLITEFEFLDSDTIAFSVSNGKVTAIVKEGSIGEKHLRPDYLADIKIESGKAVESAANAKISEDNAKASEEAAKESEENSKKSEEAAAKSAAAANDSANSIVDAAKTATEKAEEALTSANAAANSAKDAKASADNAALSEFSASNSATSAGESAADSFSSALDSAASASYASDSAILAESWAHGNTGVREGEDGDNAKYWAELAKAVTNIEIMTTERLGIGKPDGDTITVDPDGTLHGNTRIEVDEELSHKSENPVQNKAISAALTEIWDEMLRYRNMLYSGIVATFISDNNGNPIVTSNVEPLEIWRRFQVS